MTNQQTNVVNSAETTLSSALAAGATTINVVDGASFPAVPFYVTIDPRKDATREVVLVDSAKTATTFTLSAPAMRGLDGTSDAAHDAGAVVIMNPVAAHWTDINDRVDAGDTATATVQTNLDTHTAATNPHSGSASVASLDTHTASVAPHSSTIDPTANRLALRNASGQSSFADPTAAQHAATKNYVDTKAQGFAPTYAAITRSTAQSIPNSTGTQVTFTATEAESPTTFGDDANERLVIPATGFYDFGAAAQWATNTTGERVIGIHINATTTEFGDSRDATDSQVRMAVSAARQFAAGDVITLFASQTSGGALDLNNARLWAHRVA